jgi:CDP-diacylglycerol--serine O-phosphatidyltransferase
LYERRLRLFAHRFQNQISRGQLNLHLWKDQDNSFHAKGLWIDDTWILLTGNNFNPRAFHLDLENGLLIHDPKHQLSTVTSQEIAFIHQHTTRINHFKSIERLRDYPTKVKRRISQLARFNLDRLLYRFL